MNILGLGLFAILFLAIMAIISNSSSISATKITNQMFLLSCPYPINSGTITSGSPLFNTNNAWNYTIIPDNSTSDYHLTKFTCSLDPLSSDQRGASVNVYTASSTNWFAVGTSYFAYIMNFFSALGQKIQAILTILTFFLTPMNFNILGYTIADIGGIALVIVVVIYALCYVFIGLLTYKAISPFAGGG